MHGNSPQTSTRLTSELRHVRSGMAQFILRTADHSRRDRLWPCHYMLFNTNPMSLAYGACGTSLFLKEELGAVPPDTVSWLLDQPVHHDLYPPGLYVGMAGIAYTFLVLGLREEATSVMAKACESPLLLSEPNLALGAAGWGLVSLYFFTETREEKYLDLAVRAGEHIIACAERDGDTCCWRYQEENVVHYGFGYGASGIALFLMYLHRATGRQYFLDHAIMGVEFDLSNKVESELGWQWPRFRGDTLLYPYWMHGSAGIGSVLIRFHHHLGDARYKALAERIAGDSFIKYSFVPSLFEGLCGIGEFLLDMSHFTRSPVYLEQALDIAETTLWFKIDRPEGIAFPGRWLTKISNDYATGSAGIGLYFCRLLSPAGRALIDLDL